MKFSERLKEEIEFTGLRYKELSQKSGVPERALYNYVATKNPSMPPADVAVKIAKALGVSVEYLVTGNQSESQSLKIDFEKIHKYSNLINEIDSLTEKQKNLIQMIVSEFKMWK